MDFEDQLTIRCIIYASIGVFILFFNFISLFIFISGRDRGKYVLYECLCIAEFTNGLNFFLSGTFRYLLITSKKIRDPMTSKECFFATQWLIIMIIGGLFFFSRIHGCTETFPASMTLVISLERLFAVTFMAKYRLWKDNHKLIMVGLAIVFPVIMLSAAVLNVLFNTQLNSNSVCGTSSGINKFYGLAQNSLTVIIYVVGFIISVYVNRTIPQKRKCNRQEIRQLRTMITISSMSVALVAVPNAILIENSWGPIKFNDLYQGVAYSLYGIQSCLYFFIFLLLRPEFRRRSWALLRLRLAEASTSSPNLRSVLPAVSTFTSARNNSDVAPKQSAFISLALRLPHVLKRNSLQT